MLTGKAAAVCRECLWEQRVDLCGRDASQQRSHCREPGLNHIHALVREASGPAPFQADVRPLLASPDIMGVGVRVPRSSAWSSLNHSWHMSLIQLGKEQCSPPACHAHRGLGLIRQLVGSQWAKAPSPTGLGGEQGRLSPVPVAGGCSAPAGTSPQALGKVVVAAPSCCW